MTLAGRGTRNLGASSIPASRWINSEQAPSELARYDLLRVVALRAEGTGGGEDHDATPEPEPGRPAGPDFDLDDNEQMRDHLLRLAATYRPTS